MAPQLQTVRETCTGATWVDDCSVSNTGTQVDLSGNINNGNGGAPDAGNDWAPDNGDGSDNGGSGNNSGPRSEPVPSPTRTCDRFLGCRAEYIVVTLPDVTIADLASFVPARPNLAAEPSGVAIVGMPMNVVASASEQHIDGTLFDRAVTVRFVPSSFRFDYGDGTVRTSGAGGASWQQLGQAEFTPTETSHTYASRGSYSIAVTVLYEASVDFGSGNWRPVPGYVEATLGGYGVRVVEVHTALVDQTCLENPAGPGC